MKKFTIIFFLNLGLCLNIYSILGEKSKEKFTYDSKGKRDPFFQTENVKPSGDIIQAVEKKTPREILKDRGIVINSIVWDPKKPAILINDSILEEGDSIQGVIIRNIEKDSVFFEIEGEVVEVSIN